MRHPSSTALSDDTRVLVSEYVCGLLKPEERPQVHALLSRDDEALALALGWEMELLALVDALPRAQPSAALQERLQRSLGIGPPPAQQPPSQPQLLQKPSREQQTVRELPAQAPAAPVSSASAASVPLASAVATSAESAAAPVQTQVGAEISKPSTRTDEPTPSPAAPKQTVGVASPARPQKNSGDSKSLVRKLWLWRLIAVTATIAAVVGFMLPGEPPPPPVQVVKVAPTRAAILQAPGTSSTPGWTATLGPEGNLMMRPLVRTEVPVGSQALLWTRSAQIPEPRLLGRIDPNLPVQVPAAQLGALAEDQLLEITLEKDEDAAKAIPNGPILFIGQMTVFGSEAAGTPADAATAGTHAAGPITQ